MPLPKEYHYTSEDYWNLPEGERAELIGGKLYAMAPPKRVHQELIAQFTKIFGNYIDAKHGNCKIYPAPFAVNLNESDETWVEPDISIICDKTKLTEKGCLGAPDFIIEIVSPSSRYMDYSIKNALYSNAGVREYWIVDTMKKRTTIYHYEEDAAPTILPFDKTITVGIYNDLTINIAELLEQ